MNQKRNKNDVKKDYNDFFEIIKRNDKARRRVEFCRKRSRIRKMRFEKDLDE